MKTVVNWALVIGAILVWMHLGWWALIPYSLLVYALACWLWPVAACELCQGRGYLIPCLFCGGTGRRIALFGGKAHGRCRWCKGHRGWWKHKSCHGKGTRVRAGRRLAVWLGSGGLD